MLRADLILKLMLEVFDRVQIRAIGGLIHPGNVMLPGPRNQLILDYTGLVRGSVILHENALRLANCREILLQTVENNAPSHPVVSRFRVARKGHKRSPMSYRKPGLKHLAITRWLAL